MHFDKDKIESWVSTPMERIMFNIMISIDEINQKLEKNNSQETTIKKMGRKPIEKVG